MGMGGESAGLHAVLTVLSALVVAACAVYALTHRDEWIAAAGVSLFAVVLMMSWGQAWYIFWVLPFAALAASPRLRFWTVVLAGVLLLEFIPAEGAILFRLNLRPEKTALGVKHQRAIKRVFAP
jgi:hypothetical protein